LFKSIGLIALFPLSFVNCAILHPLFFWSDFAPHLFDPFLVRWTFLCLIALLPPMFLPIVQFCTPFYFFERLCTPSFAPFPSFNDDFEQNTIGKKWGAKSLKKRGEKLRS